MARSLRESKMVMWIDLDVNILGYSRVSLLLLGHPLLVKS